jgi:diacylglycerol kinase (ATP)
VSRWLAIVNPAAGLLRANRRLVRRLAATFGGRVEIAPTAAPGDGTRFAREASGYAGLLVVGGDGTIAEVLNGMARSRQELALLPAGHGNCLARDLGVGTPDLAFAAFGGATTLPIDLMRARIEFVDGGRRELLVASTLAVGYVADVVAAARAHFGWLGRHAYMAAALATRPRALELRIDGADRGARRLTNLVVNNTAHLANFRAFHRARVDDGELDVLEADYGWPRQMLHNAAVLAGSERWGPSALWQSRAVTLECAPPSRLMADGELFEAVRRVTIHCEPAAVRCRSAVR